MVEELTKETFDTVTGKGNVVVDFWAPWCGPCKMFAPIFEEVAGEMPDITFAKVNTEQEGELAQKAGIRAIPTLAFFKDGEEVDRETGAMQKEQFQEKLKDVFS